MSLVLRRSTSEFVPEWERDQFWSILCDGVEIGSIVEQQGQGGFLPRWQWSFSLHAGRFGNGLAHLCSGRKNSRGEAMVACRRAWEQVRPAIGAEGWRRHIEHTAWSDEQAARWKRQRAGTEPGGYG